MGLNRPSVEEEKEAVNEAAMAKFHLRILW